MVPFVRFYTYILVRAHIKEGVTDGKDIRTANGKCLAVAERISRCEWRRIAGDRPLMLVKEGFILRRFMLISLPQQIIAN